MPGILVESSNIIGSKPIRMIFFPSAIILIETTSVIRHSSLANFSVAVFASDRGDGFEVENQSSGFVGDLPLHISEQWNNPAHRLRGDLAIFLIVLVGKSEGLLRDQEISI